MGVACLGRVGHRRGRELGQAGLPGHARGQHLQVIGRAQPVGKLLGNGFALHGQFHLAGDAAGRHAVQKAVVLAPAPANGAADAVEKPQPDAVAAGHFGEPLLGLVYVPAAGHNAAVFVAVAVAQHHFLHPGLAGPAGGVGQEIVQHLMGVLQVVDGLEQRHHGPLAARQAHLAHEQVHHQQVAQAPGHAHDKRADARRPVRVQVLLYSAVASQHGIGLGAKRGARQAKRPGALEFLADEPHPLGFGPGAVGGQVRVGGLQHLGQGLVVEGAVLADVEPGQVEPEALDLPFDAKQHVVGNALGPNVEQALAELGQVLL
jgi:hypothetical protein